METKETKLCKHCKTEIPKKAKVCPNCRKKQNGGILKWVLIGFVFVILVGFFASGGDDEPKKTGEVETENKNEEKENEEIKNIFEAGDIVETSNLKIKYISAKEYTSDNEFIQPKDGNIYYKMEFEFENISDSDQHVSSYDFDCYADDYDMEQTWFDGLDLDATLSPGKKTKGSVFFEVPEDSKEITLEYETNFWTEDKIIFVVK